MTKLYDAEFEILELDGEGTLNCIRNGTIKASELCASEGEVALVEVEDNDNNMTELSDSEIDEVPYELDGEGTLTCIRNGTIKASELYASIKRKVTLLRDEGNGEFDLEIPRMINGDLEYDIQRGTNLLLVETPEIPAESNSLNPDKLKDACKKLNDELERQKEKMCSILEISTLYGFLQCAIADKNFPNISITDEADLDGFIYKKHLRPAVAEVAGNAREYIQEKVNLDQYIKPYIEGVFYFCKEWQFSPIKQLQFTCSRLYEEGGNCSTKLRKFKDSVNLLYKKIGKLKLVIINLQSEKEVDRNKCKEDIAAMTEQRKKGEEEIKEIKKSITIAEEKEKRAIKNQQALEKDTLGSILVRFIQNTVYGEGHYENKLRQKLEKHSNNYNKISEEGKKRQEEILQAIPTIEEIHNLMANSKNIKNVILPQLELVLNQLGYLINACEKYELYIGQVTNMVNSLHTIFCQFNDEQKTKTILQLTSKVLEVVNVCTAISISIDIHNDLYKEYVEAYLQNHAVIKGKINWAKIKNSTEKNQNEVRKFLDKRVKEDIKKGQQYLKEFIGVNEESRTITCI